MLPLSSISFKEGHLAALYSFPFLVCFLRSGRVKLGSFRTRVPEKEGRNDTAER
jgi:hypothetical protein